MSLALQPIGNDDRVWQGSLNIDVDEPGLAWGNIGASSAAGENVSITAPVGTHLRLRTLLNTVHQIGQTPFYQQEYREPSGLWKIVESR